MNQPYEETFEMAELIPVGILNVYAKTGLLD